ncbi:SigE family RNA polymerase sigma factor [Parafrankia sp. EUN1f]|uniref:SigE family RNA polymerase sigma factor n=1 Tax=Parafrankia sp. EUN1f TaxID=102897 RepID=UPI0001C4635C|nr:SigE family RNA polymerase sigma factor [Parafrankia sp. EUN1f]EFC81504.1 RNA polymerase, sigma-24 subunit, ECF subfamily [Parafrankia sp. EUN1f]
MSVGSEFGRLPMTLVGRPPVEQLSALPSDHGAGPPSGQADEPPSGSASDVDEIDWRAQAPATPTSSSTFEQYVRSNATTLLRTAMFLTGDRHAGEDLLQDVLERVYSRWRRIDDPDRYIRRALVNGASRRSRRRRRVREERLDGLSGTGRDIDVSQLGMTDRVAVREQLLAVLRTLPTQQRAVLTLRYFDDLPDPEVAALVGCSPGTVKTHTARGLARMRAALATAQDAPRPRTASPQAPGQPRQPPSRGGQA